MARMSGEAARREEEEGEAEDDQRLRGWETHSQLRDEAGSRSSDYDSRSEHDIITSHVSSSRPASELSDSGNEHDTASRTVHAAVLAYEQRLSDAATARQASELAVMRAEAEATREDMRVRLEESDVKCRAYYNELRESEQRLQRSLSQQHEQLARIAALELECAHASAGSSTASEEDAERILRLEAECASLRGQLFDARQRLAEDEQAKGESGLQEELASERHAAATAQQADAERIADLTNRLKISNERYDRLESSARLLAEAKATWAALDAERAALEQARAVEAEVRMATDKCEHEILRLREQLGAQREEVRRMRMERLAVPVGSSSSTDTKASAPERDTQARAWEAQRRELKSQLSDMRGRLDTVIVKLEEQTALVVRLEEEKRVLAEHLEQERGRDLEEGMQLRGLREQHQRLLDGIDRFRVQVATLSKGQELYCRLILHTHDLCMRRLSSLHILSFAQTRKLRWCVSDDATEIESPRAEDEQELTSGSPEMEGLKEELRELRRALANSVDQRRRLQSEIDRLQSESKEQLALQAQVISETYEQQIAGLTARAERAEVEQPELQEKELSELRAQVAAEASRREALRADLVELKSTLDVEHTASREHERERTTLRVRCAQLEQELAHMKQRQDNASVSGDVHSSLQAITAQLESLQAWRSHAENMLKQRTASPKSAMDRSTTEALQANLTSTRKDLELSSLLLACMTRSFRLDLPKDHDAAFQIIQEKGAEVARVEQDAMMLRAECEDLKRRLDAIKRKYMRQSVRHQALQQHFLRIQQEREQQHAQPPLQMPSSMQPEDMAVVANAAGVQPKLRPQTRRGRLGAVVQQAPSIGIIEHFPMPPRMPPRHWSDSPTQSRDDEDDADDVDTADGDGSTQAPDKQDSQQSAQLQPTSQAANPGHGVLADIESSEDGYAGGSIRAWDGTDKESPKELSPKAAKPRAQSARHTKSGHAAGSKTKVAFEEDDKSKAKSKMKRSHASAHIAVPMPAHNAGSVSAGIAHVARAAGQRVAAACGMAAVHVPTFSRVLACHQRRCAAGHNHANGRAASAPPQRRAVEATRHAKMYWPEGAEWY
eukprot:jgi/Chlat1/7645/Chrsp64S07116